MFSLVLAAEPFAGSCDLEADLKRVGAPGRAEGHTNAFRRAPNHVARPPEVIVVNNQQEGVEDADLACDLKAGAGGRKIADAAADACTVIERNGATFQRTTALSFASLIHGCHRGYRRSRDRREKSPLASASDGNGHPYPRSAYLSGGESDHQKMGKTTRKR